ncbi:MAG TPA: DUF488 domain-containing protein [Candidatus Saccharimonadales bacterium]|nr:DUF488 domain-containing protein [Candidatus Saccharimonadales bacterium]
MSVIIKRIYEDSAKSDGFRVLVDRLWPRGVSKEKAALDLWLKEVAPSPNLRTWFGHKPERFAEFSAKYKDELEQNPAVPGLRDIIKKNDTVTLLYAARDPKINHAAVLKDYLT